MPEIFSKLSLSTNRLAETFADVREKDRLTSLSPTFIKILKAGGRAAESFDDLPDPVAGRRGGRFDGVVDIVDR